MSDTAIETLPPSMQPPNQENPAHSLRAPLPSAAPLSGDMAAAPGGFALEEWQIRLILPHRPPVLQLDRVERCEPALGLLEAAKALGGSDPMMARERGGPPRLSTAALIEALAQCCGLLLRLRWLAAQGVDLAAFAAGDSARLEGFDIPRSVLAESQARFTAPAQPGRVMRLATRLVLSRGDMHRFNASAHGASEAVTAQIMLGFPSLG